MKNPKRGGHNPGRRKKISEQGKLTVLTEPVFTKNELTIVQNTQFLFNVW